ncbi:hypothetical protein [Fusibacter sp. JL216-2]|uniref:hypothetical protein n=1 Tax=Fusibacter sp. JL216-2 TaxID=3071453 RepID=UPI003D33EFBC
MRSIQIKWKTRFASIRLFLLIAIILVGCSKGNWKYEEWIEFESSVMERYDFIDSIDFYGNSPTLFINYNLNRNIEGEIVEQIFEESKAFLLNEEVLNELAQYHHEKYGGTLIELSISLKCEKDNEVTYHCFTSYAETTDELSENTFVEWTYENN